MREFNPPAFPLNPELKHSEATAGMSLRDYFAAHAVAGLLAGTANDELTYSDYANAAYTIADRMLTERDR